MKYLLCLFLLLPFEGFTQNLFDFPLDSTSGKITFSNIITVPGKTKEDIYKILKVWITYQYKSPKDVINVDDYESGILLIKPSYVKSRTGENLNYLQKTFYDLKFLIKDGKIKYILTDIISQSDFGRGFGTFTPKEKAFLFSKEDKEQMQYYEYRKPLAIELKEDISLIIKSFNDALTKKSELDF